MIAKITLWVWIAAVSNLLPTEFSLDAIEAFFALPQKPKVIYVAVGGKDSNAGTKAAPFATLERARDEIRKIKSEKGLPPGGVTVYLRKGSYFREKQFNLAAEDSGEPGKPVTYRAYPGEQVRLTGGVPVLGKWFKAVTSDQTGWAKLPTEARSRCLVANLPAHNINEFGKLRPRGYSNRKDPSPMELFFNDEPMTLARWPNQDFAHTTDAQGEATFGYAGNRPQRWLNATDAWAKGYWKHGWADGMYPIGKIDTLHKTVTLGNPAGSFELGNKREWRAMNLLEELDQPGEYFLDRKDGNLYFWPPALIKKAKMYVSVFGENQEKFLQAEKISYINFQDLIFEYSRSGGASVTNARFISFDNCTFRHLGTLALNLEGTDCTVENSRFYQTGGGAIQLAGGNRKQLIKSNNVVRNSHFHHFSRWNSTYNPAISLHGVGHRVSNNLMHDSPHSAIIYGGNEHIIEYNEIYRVCLNTDDAGAIYTGRDWGLYGNIIRYNFFHHIASNVSGSNGVHAVYLDDCASGATVQGNIFYDITGRAIMIGGGRDNLAENNIMIKCGAAFFSDRRGLTRIKDIPQDSWNLKQKIESVNYKQPPWSTQYPKLAKMMDNGYNQAKLPEGNIIRRNIGWENKRWLQEPCKKCGSYELYTFEHNLENQDPRPENIEQLNFNLKKDSPAFNLPGFQPIPFDKIGINKK